MTSLAPSYEQARPQTHQGLQASPHPSPRIQRPSSQASYHVGYSPNIDQAPMTAYPGNHAQPFRSFTPNNLSLPLPHQNYGAAYPSTAPPVPFYPEQTPLWDARGSQPMIRTVSHGHPMHSATDHTASSRYSSSPHSATNEALPPSAGGGFPSINPAIFNSSYPMSRSTSGASDAQEYNTRLLTPHAEYRALGHGAEPYGGMHDVEMRKMSDSLNRMPSSRYYPQAFNFDHVGPHPQPDMGRAWGNEFGMSAERGGQKVGGGNETDYEREREQQIMNNKKLIEDMGLGGGGGAFGRSRSVTGTGRDRSRTPVKKRLSSAEAIRSSPRIASIHRSYANLDGDVVEEDSDEYNSGEEPEIDDEDEFRPAKRTKGTSRGYGRKASYNSKGARKADLSLWGLLEVYPEIPRSYPLFYYTLNNDLSINSDSVPLIGSIPSTATAMEKATTLQSFFHRGRRVLSQLDAFTARCDRKYDGAQEKLMELDFNTRIAIRDVRRKVVERCENYKYTRRDILDKNVGKNKWQPIESGLVDWKPGMTQNDPAGDLANVTLTLPTPPASALFNHGRQYADRQNRPFPRSRVASAVPHSARTVSVTMGEPDSAYPVNTPALNYGYPAGEAPPPMYGEDEVPMSVHLATPVQSNGSTSSSLPAIAQGGPTSGSVVSAGLPPVPEWQESASSNSRGVKRSHSDDEEDDDEDKEPGQLW